MVDETRKITVIPGPDGTPAFAVLPWADYERLRTEAARGATLDPEDAADIAAAIAADRRLESDIRRARRASGCRARSVEPFIPIGVTKRILAGATPIRAWRAHAALTQEQLAERAGVSRGYLAQLESGVRDGTPAVLARLARELGVLVDDLVDNGGEPAEPARRRGRPKLR